MPTAAQSSAVQTGARGKSIGARPIRWSWWALAVGISAVLWFGIARAFGWF